MKHRSNYSVFVNYAPRNYLQSDNTKIVNISNIRYKVNVVDYITYIFVGLRKLVEQTICTDHSIINVKVTLDESTLCYNPFDTVNLR